MSDEFELLEGDDRFELLESDDRIEVLQSNNRIEVLPSNNRFELLQNDNRFELLPNDNRFELLPNDNRFELLPNDNRFELLEKKDVRLKTVKNPTIERANLEESVTSKVFIYDCPLLHTVANSTKRLELVRIRKMNPNLKTINLNFVNSLEIEDEILEQLKSIDLLAVFSFKFNVNLFSNLENLFLQKCKLDRIITIDIDLPNLTTFIINNCYVGDNYLEELHFMGKTPNLKTLRLYENGIKKFSNCYPLDSIKNLCLMENLERPSIVFPERLDELNLLIYSKVLYPKSLQDILNNVQNLNIMNENYRDITKDDLQYYSISVKSARNC